MKLSVVFELIIVLLLLRLLRFYIEELIGNFWLLIIMVLILM